MRLVQWVDIRWLIWATVVVLVAAPLVYVAAPLVGLRMFALLTVGWWLPGLLLATAWRLPALELPGLILAASGLGLGWLVAGALICHYIPGPLTLWLLWSVYEGAALILLVVVARQPATPVVRAGSSAASLWRWGIVLLLVATGLRLPGLGYHEFHADEVVLLRQARRSIEGQDDALAEHTKGPGEIAITTALYRAMGTEDEWTARLPFALMSIFSVIALAWLGTRMLGARAGFWAGLLLAVNGFALGLSRIAQYQAAILLLSALAVWAALEFAERGEPRWLALAAALATTGMVMHYEFGLLCFALLYLTWLGWRRSTQRRALVMTIAGCGVGGALFLGMAYLPALFHPYFSTTQGYLSNRLGTIGTFNLPFFVEMGTFYNATYFFAGLVGLMLAGTVLAWRQERTATITLGLWWLPFFVLYIFIVRFPGTHFYLLMNSWSLLAAAPLASISLRGRARALSLFAPAVLALWLVVAVYYLFLIFFRQAPEYLVNYDQTRSSFYWAPYPVPEKPRFGFPIHEGWKTIGVLGEWGYLQGTYASNDEAWSLRRWYLRPFDKRNFDEEPDYIFVARHVQEPDPDYTDAYEEHYTRIGEVHVRAEPRLQIWAREALPVPYVSFDAEQFTTPFLHSVATVTPWPDPPIRVQDEPLDENIVLARAHLAETSIRRGDSLHLLLVWDVRAPLPVDYKLFVHVADEDGRPVAQWDGLPGMNTARTSTWTEGSQFRDHVLLQIPAEAEPGDYRVLVGLYDGASGERLGGRAVPVTRLRIR